MSAKSFVCGGDGCRLDSQPPGAGNDGVRRYSKYSECMEGCGSAMTPTPGGTPMPTVISTPVPTPQPVYNPGHIISYACNDSCLPKSGAWPNQKTSFASRKVCLLKCGRTKATVDPKWGTGVIEGDEVVLPIALVGNINRHVLNFM